MKLKILGFSTIVLILLSIGYQKYSEYRIHRSINNYDECVAAKGSIIQESYPATCITKLGTRFTEPIVTDKIESSPVYKDYTHEFAITVPANWYKTPTQYWNYDQNEELKPPVYVQSRDRGKLKIEVGTYESGSIQSLINGYTTPTMDPNETYSISKINAAKVDAILIESKSGLGDRSVVIIENPHNFHIYVLMFYLDFANYRALRDQILSTFRFTN